MDTAQSSERELIRQEILSILLRLLDRGKALALPAPPQALIEARHSLASDTYTVLVVGEAKRGKSTFVNALIGRTLLPTAVEIATSQVFRIGHADQPTFRLRFEDGSQRPIAEQELARYGSQAVADVEGTPRLDSLVRWIEVEVPLRFLPPNLRLMDTPGLGSLYGHHAEITQRFLPHADAVIYVLDSSRPLGTLDLEFIAAILAITPRMFFIQTMIDLHRRAQWQEVRDRNQALLAERFGDKLVDTRVWPVSSTLLLTGAETEDDDYVTASRQKDMIAALQGFLFQVAGIDRAAQALVVAEGYQRIGARALAARLAALEERSKEQRAATQQRAAQRREQFEAEWGERGGQRASLLDAARRAIGTGKQGFAQIFQPGGDLALDQEAKIAAITSVSEANAVGSRLAAEVIGVAAATWQQVCAQVELRCLELLQPLADQAVALEVQQDLDLAAVDTGAPLETFKDDWWLRIRGAYANTSFLIGLGSLVPGIGAAAHLAALWNVARGSWKGADNPQVKIAQQELRRHLAAVLQRVRRHFLDVDLATGRPCLVDDYFFAVERALMEHIGQVVRRQSEQARAEVGRLVEAARLDDQQRAAQAAEIQQGSVEWDAIGKGIEHAAARLRPVRPLA